MLHFLFFQGEAEVGVIEKITLINFMCHKRLDISLCPNVNFILGRNGSKFTNLRYQQMYQFVLLRGSALRVRGQNKQNSLPFSWSPFAMTLYLL